MGIKFAYEEYPFDFVKERRYVRGQGLKSVVAFAVADFATTRFLGDGSAAEKGGELLVDFFAFAR